MSPPTVVASWTRAVLDFALSDGLDVDALRAQAGLTDQVLDHPDHRVPYANHLALWEALQETVSDPSFGIRMGLASASAQSLDVLGYLMRSSTTMGEAIQRMERYARLVNEAAIQRFEIVDGEAILIDGPLHGPRWPPLYCDQVAATYFSLTSTWTGLDLRGTRIEIPHPPPPCDPTPHTEALGDGVEFNAARLAVHLPRGIVDQPFMTAEPDLAAHLQEHADHLLARLPDDDLLRQVADALTELLHDDASLRLETVSAKLALSARSLQRRLHDHETSFQELLDGVRHRAALELLSETRLSLDECAERLGFSSVTAFRRAFIRWVGAPPGRFRKTAGALAH